MDEIAQGQAPQTRDEPDPLEIATRVWEYIKKPEHANAIMAIFTTLIFAYAVIAVLQWDAMRDQLGEMKIRSLGSVDFSLSFIPFKSYPLAGSAFLQGHRRSVFLSLDLPTRSVDLARCVC